MTSESIAIREDVCQKLLQWKKGEESFSDAIARLLEGRNELMSFAGAMSGDREFDQAMSDIAMARTKAMLRA